QQRKTLRIAASRGLPGEVHDQAEVRLGEGVAGTVAELGDAVIVDDIEKDARFARTNDPKYGTGSFICMPVRVGDRIIGVINLASGMAHHLNNLFAVILGRLETLLVKVAEPEARRYLEIVQRAAQDGAEVVRRVQRFSRVQPVSRSMPVDLNQLAQEVLDLTRPRWHNEALLRQIRIDTARSEEHTSELQSRSE